ncbi:hypothetical protein GLR48_19745 [Loktanella sp. M215]|nr:hypothetical protein [Loktanella sp. M215]
MWEADKINRKISFNRNEFLRNGVNNSSINRISTQSRFGNFEARIKEFLKDSVGENLIIDITSMPQKVLFFLCKLCLKLPLQTKNIIFTYTEPEKYDQNALVENHEAWDALPSFRLSRDSVQDRKVVIAIGYDPMGLPEQVNSSDFNEGTVSFLFPFPSHPDRVSRNWKFIRRIFPNSETRKLDIKRVDGLNIPEVYDELCGIGGYGTIALSLAPYGPKPVSLAMALYACRYSVSPMQTGVFYNQPLDKNPDYSIGIRFSGGIPAINCYCVRLNGINLY